jgi:hypothetical protein
MRGVGVCDPIKLVHPYVPLLGVAKRAAWPKTATGSGLSAPDSTSHTAATSPR